MGFEIFKTSEFVEWFKDQPLKTQIVIEARLNRLADDRHWGFVNRFDGLNGPRAFVFIQQSLKAFQ